MTLKEQSHYLEATKAELTDKNLIVWHLEKIVGNRKSGFEVIKNIIVLPLGSSSVFKKQF